MDIRIWQSIVETDVFEVNLALLHGAIVIARCFVLLCAIFLDHVYNYAIVVNISFICESDQFLIGIVQVEDQEKVIEIKSIRNLSFIFQLIHCVLAFGKELFV